MCGNVEMWKLKIKEVKFYCKVGISKINFFIKRFVRMKKKQYLCSNNCIAHILRTSEDKD